MSCLAVILNMRALLILGILFSGNVLAQTTYPPDTAVQLPSTSQSVPGRPTLKRRKPLAESSLKVSGRKQQLETDESKLKESVGELETPLFRFEGLNSVSEEYMLLALRERRMDLWKQRSPSAEDLTDIVVAIRTILAERGWDNALVFLREDNGNGIPVKTFVIVEGQRVPVVDVRFEGSNVFSPETLSTNMVKCSQDYKSDLNDKEILNVCLRRTENLIRSNGYLQAKFGEPRKEIRAGAATLTVPVKEGARYRLGKIEIEGFTQFSTEQILKILDIRTGEIANGEKIAKGLFENLKELYAEKGYLHYTSDPEPEFHVEGIVDFRITIEEGPRFKVRSITFKGHDEISMDFMRLALSINEGDYFNHKLFRDGIKELWKLGFELDPDKDVEFKTDDEEAALDITILLKRANGN